VSKEYKRIVPFNYFMEDVEKHATNFSNLCPPKHLAVGGAP